MLLSGEIPMGEQLDERELSARLGVSRTPLREAVASLVRAGLVEYFPYRGNYVKKWTAKQVRDLYQVRKSLEVLAIQIATPKLSNEDIDNIRKVLSEAELSLRQGNVQTFGEADSRFHSMIVQKTENSTLIDTLRHLSVQIQMIRTIANRDASVLERTTKERPRILNALEKRDMELAAQLMADHIEGVSQAVIMQLEELEHAGKEK
jgi:DNA-binding GntR family transcriptional regulator